MRQQWRRRKSQAPEVMKKTESMEVERQRQDESKRDSEVEIEYRHEEEGSIYKFLGARQASVRGSSSIGGSSSIQSSRRSSSRSVAGLKAGCRNHAKKARRACLPAIDEETRQPEKESAWLGSIRRKNVKGGKAYEEYVSNSTRSFDFHPLLVAHTLLPFFRSCCRRDFFMTSV